jgi:endo-1,3-1,4-beta-glycanase ExoK
MKTKAHGTAHPFWGRIFAGSVLLVAGITGPAEALGTTFFDDLTSFNTSLWQKSNGWTNGSMFNCGWRADHIDFTGGVMSLTLDNATCTSGCSGKPYASGEYRSADVYGYGRFETRMKPPRGSGVVSSFFIYNPAPFDEVDIEFLGKDTTKMQINYYTSGVGGHEVMINLGFDASLNFHDYAFVWSAGSIQWYVDSVLVHTEDGSRGPLPSAPGKIMVNLWPGIGVNSWIGSYSYTGPLYADYESIRYIKP